MVAKMMELSTAHITKDTEKWLNKEVLLSNEGTMDVSVYEKSGDGWFIPVNERVFTEEIRESKGIPVEFFDVYNYAVKNHCKWLLIDHQGDIIEDLPQYKH